ncbi:MAG: AMP-binding protein [Rhodocyclales bacterium]|nr:AMP-binding protein [Rhodocyclales bacterium]
MLALIEQLVAELRPAASIRAGLDSRLDKDLGLDSLARVELMARIERAFAIQLNADLLGTAETPRDLLAAIHVAGGAVVEVSAHLRREALAGVGEDSPEGAMNLVDMLLWHVHRHPARPHVMFQRSAAETVTFTYGELLASARLVAGGLRRRGVRPGDFIALMLPTGLEFFQSFYGILLAGAVPVPIYPPTRPGQIEDHLRRQAGILKNCEAIALLSFDAARLVAHILSGLVPSLRHVTTPEELRNESAIASATDDHRGASGEIAFLQYTSGSTGTPKGVTLDHGNLLANIRAWGQAVALSPADVVVSWLPLYHDMGLIGAWLGSLYHACPLVLMSPLDFLGRPDRWLWAIHEHRGTVTAAPNFAFELCLRHADPQRLQGLDLSSWRYAANGAEPVAADTLARFAAAFRPYGFRAEALAPVYGLAECSVGLAVSPPGRGMLVDRVRRDALAAGEAIPAPGDDDAALRLVACGIPLPGHDVRVVDEDGAVLPQRRVGRIEFRGPSATRGYYRNDEATARLIRDGWLDSGDLGYLAEGDIVITGRLKDMIIRGGRNLYPYELEEAVGAIPGIRRGCVAVFGAAAREGTERLVVVAECRERDESVRDELVHRINGQTVDLLGTPPDDVVLAPPHAVLKTSSGKIRRAATRDAYLGGSLGRAGRAPWRQLLRLGVSGRVQRLIRIAELLYGSYAWAAFVLLMLPAVVGILVLPRISQRWHFSAALVRLCAVVCGIRLLVEGREPAASVPTVYVANHASYLDVFVLLATLPGPVSFVAKQELQGQPLLALVLRRLGTRFVERFDARQGIEDLRRVGEGGVDTSLLFFPEGTFTSRPGLRSFRLGAFQLAARMGLSVSPIALAGTREVLRDQTWLPRRGTVRITYENPVAPDGSDWDAALRLRDATRTAILRQCGEPDLESGAR